MTPRCFLGFDYGLKRIGVAIGQELTGTASPLVTVAARDGKPDWPAITQLFEEWQPDAVIIGLPLNLDGSDHEISRRARRFGNQLHGRYNLPAYFVDERLSSEAAEALLKSTAGKKARRSSRHALQHSLQHSLQQKEDIDKMAAMVILQTWMSEQP